MSASTIKADGDTWRAELGDEGAGRPRVVMFFCTTTDQRPYRVVEIDAQQFSGEAGLSEASAEEVQSLFDASKSMGAPRDYPTYGS